MKPREFFVTDIYEGIIGVYHTQKEARENAWNEDDVIHVIELHPLQDQEDTYYMRKCDRFESEIAKLADQLKRAESVIEFYANILSWTHFKGDSDFNWGRPIIDYNDCNHVYPDTEWVSYGGKRAREYLAKNKKAGECMKNSEHIRIITGDLELIKSEIWALLENLEAAHNNCPFEDKIRSITNELLDYIESIELDSELNPDGN